MVQGMQASQDIDGCWAKRSRSDTETSVSSAGGSVHPLHDAQCAMEAVLPCQARTTAAWQRPGCFSSAQTRWSVRTAVSLPHAPLPQRRPTTTGGGDGDGTMCHGIAQTGGPPSAPVHRPCSCLAAPHLPLLRPAWGQPRLGAENIAENPMLAEYHPPEIARA